MFSQVLALGSLVVAAGSLSLGFVTYFLKVGGEIVDEAISVVVAIEAGQLELANLSGCPISQIEIYVADTADTLNLVSPLPSNYLDKGQKATVQLPPNLASSSVTVMYIGTKGLRWKHVGNGKLELDGTKKRSLYVRAITSPWIRTSQS